MKHAERVALIKAMPFIPDRDIQVGSRYLFCPPHAASIQLCYVCSIAFGLKNQKVEKFFVQDIAPDGSFGKARMVNGWFKSTGVALARSRRVAHARFSGRERLKLPLQVELQLEAGV